MAERHKLIRERNLEAQILDLFYKEKLPYRVIAEKLNIPMPAVQRFLREDKLKNYNDNRLKDIAKVDDYNSLSIIEGFFEAASYTLADMRFLGILSQNFREHIAKLITEQGMDAFNSAMNENILAEYRSQLDSVAKISTTLGKHLDTYINLFTQVLDIQREISYVKVVTEILQKQDPETYRKIQKALQEDNAARAVMDSLDSGAIVDFWHRGTPSKAKLALESANEEDDSE